MTRNQLIIPDPIANGISERSKLKSSFASARSVGNDHEQTAQPVDLDGPTADIEPNDNAPHIEVKRATNELTKVLSEIESTESQIKATQNAIGNARAEAQRNKILTGLFAALILFIVLAILAS